MISYRNNTLEIMMKKYAGKGSKRKRDKERLVDADNTDAYGVTMSACCYEYHNNAGIIKRGKKIVRSSTINCRKNPNCLYGLGENKEVLCTVNYNHTVNVNLLMLLLVNFS